MSCIVIIPVVIAASPAVGPALGAAVAAAAAALGFASTRSRSRTGIDEELDEEVECDVACEEVAETLLLGETMTYERDGVLIQVTRDERGRTSVKVSGRGKTKAELKALGDQMVEQIAQQYAYHRVRTMLADKDLNVVGEEVDENGNVHLKVRTYG
jgi:DNA repair ATPase RecN